MQQQATTTDAPRYFFNDLAEANGLVPGSAAVQVLHSAAVSPASGCPGLPAADVELYRLVGTQRVPKFNAPAEAGARTPPAAPTARQSRASAAPRRAARSLSGAAPRARALAAHRRLPLALHALYSWGGSNAKIELFCKALVVCVIY